MSEMTVALYNYVCSNAPKCKETWTRRLEHLDGDKCNVCGGTIQLTETLPNQTITIPHFDET
jgi:hypothetical protein